MDEGHERSTTEDAQLDAAVDRLSQTYAADDTPLTEDDVAEAVHGAADELHNAPVQMFVPLLAENKARSDLHQRREERGG
jgi:hypothetical protein